MIGGNTKGVLQVKNTTKNKIGEHVPTWHDVIELTGFLDLQAGDSKWSTYGAKIQESTHIFICDYKLVPGVKDFRIAGDYLDYAYDYDIDYTSEGKVIRVKAETTQIVIDSLVYDVLLIDDPMNLHKHLEIYLKFTGGQ